MVVNLTYIYMTMAALSIVIFVLHIHHTSDYYRSAILAHAVKIETPVTRFN